MTTDCGRLRLATGFCGAAAGGARILFLGDLVPSVGFASAFSLDGLTFDFGAGFFFLPTVFEVLSI